jgi:hypothetical protein
MHETRSIMLHSAWKWPYIGSLSHHEHLDRASWRRQDAESSLVAYEGLASLGWLPI